MSFRIALLENSCLFEEHIDPPGKFMSVRRTDGPSWKIHVCSRNKWTLLENYKKVAPGKKEQIFSKTVSVAASVYYLQLYNDRRPSNLALKLLFG